MSYTPKVGDIVTLNGTATNPGGDGERMAPIGPFELREIHGNWAQLLESGRQAILEENATPFTAWPVDQLDAVT
jgi:hypothetical protein